MTSPDTLLALEDGLVSTRDVPTEALQLSLVPGDKVESHEIEREGAVEPGSLVEWALNRWRSRHAVSMAANGMVVLAITAAFPNRFRSLCSQASADFQYKPELDATEVGDGYRSLIALTFPGGGRVIFGPCGYLLALLTVARYANAVVLSTDANEAESQSFLRRLEQEELRREAFRAGRQIGGKSTLRKMRFLERILQPDDSQTFRRPGNGRHGQD